MSKATSEIPVPLLKEIKIRNRAMPLWYVHWEGLVGIGLRIRQHVARPMKKGGLDFTMSQNENTQRGVLTIVGHRKYAKLLKEGIGAEAWLRRLITVINLETQGAQPIERFRLCRTNKELLAYYSPLCSKQLEVVLYIDSGTEVDGADMIHLERSHVDVETRDWQRLTDQLPLDIWVYNRA